MNALYTFKSYYIVFIWKNECQQIVCYRLQEINSLIALQIIHFLVCNCITKLDDSKTHTYSFHLINNNGQELFRRAMSTSLFWYARTNKVTIQISGVNPYLDYFFMFILNLKSTCQYQITYEVRLINKKKINNVFLFGFCLEKVNYILLRTSTKIYFIFKYYYSHYKCPFMWHS